MSVAALHDVRPRDRGASPADLRRADWRFLLPDPSLGRVAVAGAPDAELLRALGLVAVAVTAAGVGGGGGHDVDVAVAS
ncbi:MAG TPA: hypothetical protein VLA98_10630, partial [Solirubrobacteraceae bacterium]|nr:hypothetical protein [Solirubrobacteraceae bacterium]